MNIFPVGVNFNRFNKTQQKESKPVTETVNSTELSSMSEVSGRSMINFRGLQLHKLDKLFVDTVAAEMNFSKENTTKFTQIISDFLKERNYKSLGDMSGDEFFDTQCDLLEKFSDNFSFPNDVVHEYFVNEFTNRCDSKEDYIPGTLEKYKLENLAMENMIIHTITSIAGDASKFNDVITENLGLNGEQPAKFKSIISEYLSANNLATLKSLRGEDFFNEQAELISKISAEFNLSDNEENILNTEMVNYIYSKPNNYTPMTTRFDKDFDLFDAICDKNGMDDSLRAEIFDNIKQIALKNGTSNLFEVFTNPNIKDKYLSTLPADLIIDLALLKDDVNIIKHKSRDVFYGSVRDDIIIKALQEEFNFSKLTLEAIRDEICKRHPNYIEGGEYKDITQIAFELADKFNLQSGAENKIKQIIQKTDNLEYKALDVFIINQMKDLH